MIGFGAIVKSIERLASAVEARMDSASRALFGRRRRPALMPIPARGRRRGR